MSMQTKAFTDDLLVCNVIAGVVRHDALRPSPSHHADGVARAPWLHWLRPARHAECTQGLETFRYTNLYTDVGTLVKLSLQVLQQLHLLSPRAAHLRLSGTSSLVRVAFTS
jgi:hypothetical protein